MSLGFLQLPAEEKRLYFAQAAARRGLSPVIMEKDFWVCWMLQILFTSAFGKWLVFKGGTSLSKVYGAIARFSEDIDLSLSPEFLNLPDAGPSRSQADKWMKRAETACAHSVRDQIQPELQKAVVDALGERQIPWFEFAGDPITNSPALLFHYPGTQPDGFAYLKRSVKLEFGSLTDQQPKDTRPIRPWLADEFPQAFGDWECEVVALGLDRSFWEKATILHVEHHRPAAKPTPDRFSRHYADTAALAQHSIVEAAIKLAELRERVVAWKSQFFGANWARYDLARPGSFKLLPPTNRVAELSRDYRAMRDMYLTEPLSFESVLNTLGDLEDKINA